MSEVAEKNSEVGRRCISTDDGTKLVVDGHEFSRKCEYFKLLFQYETEEEILVHGVPGHVMNSIAEYVEKETLKINADNVVALLEACDYLRFADMQHQVLSRLPEFICSTNCVEWANVAGILHLPDMLGLVQDYIVTHFPTVVRASSSIMGDLSLDVFEKILSDDNLVVSGEDKVLDAIERWVESDCSNRFKDVPSLLRCIRYRDCSESFIQNLMNLPIVRKNEFCSEMRSKVQQQEVMDGASLRNVLGAIDGGKIMSQSSRNSCGKIILSVESYHCRDRRSCGSRASYARAKSVLINVKLAGCYVTITAASKDFFFPFYTFGSGHRVYMFNRYINYVYDMKKETWTKILRPVLKCQQWWYVLVNDRVYICRMYTNEKEPVSLFVASYNPESNAWFDESTTLVKTSVCGYTADFKAVAIRDCIYVFAYHKNSILTRNETDNNFIFARFNTCTRAWDDFEAPRIARGVGSISMVANENQFFFISDSTAPDEPRDNENYKYNFGSQRWENCPMPPRDPDLVDRPTKLRFVVRNGILFLYEVLDWAKEKAESVLHGWMFPATKASRSRPQTTRFDRTAMWRWDDKLATWVREFGKPWFTMTLDAEDQEDVREMFLERVVEPMWKKAVEEWAFKYPVK